MLDEVKKMVCNEAHCNRIFDFVNNSGKACSKKDIYNLISDFRRVKYKDGDDIAPESSSCTPDRHKRTTSSLTPAASTT